MGSAPAQTLVEIRAAYDERSSSPVEVVDSCLERITSQATDVDAFTEVLSERARERAEESLRRMRAGTERGTLDGIPVAVKELFDVAGVPTRAGSEVRADAPPATRSAAIVRALEAKGAIVVGITRSHEFAWGITTRHGRLAGVCNPRDTSRIAGGSSGGSAAAVAAGCVPLAVGTDTGGSIRIPAAFCGVTGWKPRFGLFSTAGCVPLAPSMDHVGLMASTPGDMWCAARGLGVGLGAGMTGRPPVIGVIRDDSLPALDAGIDTAFLDAVDRLRKGGAEIRRTSLPRADMVRSTFATLQMAEARRVHREQLRTWPSRAASYGADVRRRLEAADLVTDDEISSAAERRREITTATLAALSTVDAILLPSTPCQPPTIDDPDTAQVNGAPLPLRDAVMPFTVLANVTGIPAATVPVATLPGTTIPASVQLVWRPEADAPAFLALEMLHEGWLTR